jgi:hypothetical protein
MVSVKYDLILGALREEDTSSGGSGGSSQYLSSVNYTGTDCTGSDGATNRVLTQANALIITVGQNTLQPITDYTISGNDITFLVNIYNDMKITIWFNTVPSYTNSTGASCSGSDGATNRTLAGTNVRLVVVDKKMLHPDVDYTTTPTTITFLVNIFNDMKITIWSW